MFKKAANLSKRWWFLCKSSVKTPPQMNRWLIRSLILHKYDRDEGEILPPNWKVQPAGRRSKFDKKSMGNNRKKAPRNTSPKLKSSKWPSPGLWTSFWQGCSELERKIETLIDSTHIQEGYDCLTSAISDSNNILKVVKVSQRGHGTRLSIRTKDPNNHSDTETGTLSRQLWVWNNFECYLNVSYYFNVRGCSVYINDVINWGGRGGRSKDVEWWRD